MRDHNRQNEDEMRGVFNGRPAKEMIAPADFDLLADRETSRVWVLHEKPFINQDRVTRAEYDTGRHSLRFVSKDGSIQYLGAAVGKLLQPHLRQANEITAILTDKEGHIHDLFAVPLKQVNSEKNEEFSASGRIL